jgi:hypothetical protein
VDAKPEVSKVEHPWSVKPESQENLKREERYPWRSLVAFAMKILDNPALGNRFCLAELATHTL